MKLQSTTYRKKVAVIAADMFLENKIQVFDKRTGEYLATLNIGEDVHELAKQPEIFP